MFSRSVVPDSWAPMDCSPPDCAVRGILQARILEWFALIAQMVESAYNVENPFSIPGLGRSPREGNGYPLQYSCLENPMDRGAWRATVDGVAKSRTRLSG